MLLSQLMQQVQTQLINLMAVMLGIQMIEVEMLVIEMIAMLVVGMIACGSYVNDVNVVIVHVHVCQMMPFVAVAVVSVTVSVHVHVCQMVPFATGVVCVVFDIFAEIFV